jgi:hypothetical protein
VDLGDLDGALAAATAAADFHRQRQQSGAIDPDELELQYRCADAYANRASVLQALLRLDDALKELRDSLAILRRLEAGGKFKDGPAMVRGRRMQVEAAIALCQALPRAVEDPAVAEKQPILYFTRVCVLLNQGRTADAEKAADLLGTFRPRDAESWLGMARGYALSVASLTPGKRPEEYTDAERAMRRRFLDRGVAALNRAADLGYKDAATLKTDPEYAGLRKEPGFRALVERLEAGGK